MNENFYIRFRSAYRDEGDTHYLLAEPREQVDALVPLLYQLILSETEPCEFQACPVCHQAFEVSFLRYPRIAKTIIIGTECKTCNIIVLFESNKIPLWVSTTNSLLENLRRAKD